MNRGDSGTIWVCSVSLRCVLKMVKIVTLVYFSVINSLF